MIKELMKNVFCLEEKLDYDDMYRELLRDFITAKASK